MTKKTFATLIPILFLSTVCQKRKSPHRAEEVVFT